MLQVGATGIKTDRQKIDGVWIYGSLTPLGTVSYNTCTIKLTEVRITALASFQQNGSRNGVFTAAEVQCGV
jgi:hypothetical protein